jgi:hypothetical protein
MADPALLRARTHIASEMLSSEKAYVDFLKILQDVYDIPLKQAVNAKKQLLTQQEITLIFGQLPPIYTGALAFHQRLEAVRRLARSCSCNSSYWAGRRQGLVGPHDIDSVNTFFGGTGLL